MIRCHFFETITAGTATDDLHSRVFCAYAHRVSKRSRPFSPQKNVPPMHSSTGRPFPSRNKNELILMPNFRPRRWHTDEYGTWQAVNQDVNQGTRLCTRATAPECPELVFFPEVRGRGGGGVGVRNNGRTMFLN